jgi:hypothetical protein
VFNPYFLVAFLYVALAVLGALDAALIHFEFLPAFAGLRWVRIHFITLVYRHRCNQGYSLASLVRACVTSKHQLILAC